MLILEDGPKSYPLLGFAAEHKNRIKAKRETIPTVSGEPRASPISEHGAMRGEPTEEVPLSVPSAGNFESPSHY